MTVPGPLWCSPLSDVSLYCRKSLKPVGLFRFRALLLVAAVPRIAGLYDCDNDPGHEASSARSTYTHILGCGCKSVCTTTAPRSSAYVGYTIHTFDGNLDRTSYSPKGRGGEDPPTNPEHSPFKSHFLHFGNTVATSQVQGTPAWNLSCRSPPEFHD